MLERLNFEDEREGSFAAFCEAYMGTPVQHAMMVQADRAGFTLLGQSWSMEGQCICEARALSQAFSQCWKARSATTSVCACVPKVAAICWRRHLGLAAAGLFPSQAWRHLLDMCSCCRS